MKTIDVSVRLSWPIDNQRTDRYASLTIMDKKSGLSVLTLDLTPEDLADVLANSSATVKAEIPELKNFQNLGRQYVVGPLDFPEELATRNSRVITPEMTLYATETSLAAGWDGHFWRTHNYGWSLTGYKYVDEEQE